MNDLNDEVSKRKCRLLVGLWGEELLADRNDLLGSRPFKNLFMCQVDESLEGLRAIQK